MVVTLVFLYVDFVIYLLRIIKPFINDPRNALFKFGSDSAEM